MKLLLELRPALDGHAGIPQETRLLFRGLRMLEEMDVEGLIIHSGRVLARGLPADPEYSSRRLSADREIYKLSRVIISLEQSLYPNFLNRTGIDFDRILPNARLRLVPGAVFERHRQLESGNHIQERGKPLIPL